MKKCPKCNTINSDDAHFCRYCGAKLPGMFALVCPKCGKVSPLGTRICPVCHTSLKQAAHQPVATTPYVRRRYRWTTKLVVAAITVLLALGTIYYVVNTQQLSLDQRSAGYDEVEMTYYDQHKHRLGADYYIIRGTAKEPDNSRLPVAYIGHNQAGKEQVDGVSVDAMRRAYRRSKQHGELVINAHNTILTVPRRVEITISRKEVRGSNGYFAPSLDTYYPVKVSGNPAARSLKIWIIISTAG
ncbi:zinc ribbon domain-containing protein [Limosilactobacillus avium]|uniref:zinc ribbon domain-containing protein n=1 Tax=Limosilactobacillus avium TaxID=2991831 RepID=UPI0024BB08E4|nr:zinc-ribbon domain-containing protein [Limosilactobacillus avium]